MKCRLCNSDSLVLHYTQGKNGKYKYYKCQHCNLVNLDVSNVDMTVNQDKYALKYPDPNSYAASKGSFDTFAFLNTNIKPNGKYLDIGCGNGSLLNLARKAGWEVRGLELSEYLATNIREKLGIDVQVADFLSLKNLKPEYDLITLRHVLEHLLNPIPAMTNINQMLKLGGVALMEFPNIQALSLRFRRTPQRTGIHDRNYKENYIPGHFNEYSRSSFKYLCEKTGFELVLWSTYSSNNSMNPVYSIFPVGTKARVIIKKVKDIK